MAAPLVARLLLDALGEFGLAIDHVLAPGQSGRIGRLNSAGWVIAHATAATDAWINAYAQGVDHDPWCSRWQAAQRAQPDGAPLDPPFVEAKAAFERAVDRATSYIELHRGL